PVVGRLGGYYKLKHYVNCDHLVGITPDLVEHIVGQGRDRSEVSLIPNFGEYSGGDLPDRVTARRELDLADGDYVMLALGRLHEVKAHDTLIRALARVRREQGPPPILLIAGEGPLRSELTALCKEMGLSDRVRLLGWRRDISRLMAACDLSVFPSRYEPNGTVVMESWAHERPLVASRAKGPEWLVDDGENGLLFPIDDVEALAACIDKVMHDSALAARLVAGGLAKWQDGFSRDAVVRQYLKLFENLRSR
ncbi:MAG: glycosyltransferase, partial [Opitutales bacterium]